MRVSLDHAHIFASDAAATVGFFETMFDDKEVMSPRAGARCSSHGCC
jgi:hypothetical protein